MNEKAINQVISEYAIEVANLRITVATLQSELEDVKLETETVKETKTKTKKEEK